MLVMRAALLTRKAEIAAIEKLYHEELMSTHDANEGIAAFLEKRDPTWTNQ